MIATKGRGKIKPPRRGLYGTSDAFDFEDAWGLLRASLQEIHSKNASQLSFEELYRHAYKLVLKKKGDALYQRVKDFEEDWLSNTVQPRILLTVSPILYFTNLETNNSASTNNERRAEGEKLLLSLKAAWQDHNLCMNMVTDVLMYMERVYCKDFRKPSIFTAAMGQFRDCVLRIPVEPEVAGNTTIFSILTTVMLDQIRMDRDGEMVDRALLKSCVYMLEGLYETEDEDESTKLYLTTFEPAFLSVSRAFYKAEGAALLHEADAGTFCRHARKRANEEQDRCRSTLSPLTSPKIKCVVEEELMRNYLHEVITLESSGVHVMLDNDRLTDLQLVYDLSSRVDPEKQELKEAVQSRVMRLGSQINQTAANTTPTQVQSAADGRPKKPDEGKPTDETKAPEKPINQQTTAALTWVNDILQLKLKYDHILSAAFDNDQSLQTAITKSFGSFINEFERSSEYLSLFFDDNMKKGIRGKTENEVDNLIEQAVTFLRYIQDKDMFERYYKKHLSRRLLMKRSVSMDAERQMISKMKLAVGNAFTTRIEKMFQDMSTSADLTHNYKQHVASLGDPDPRRAELEVSILTSTMWPMESMAPRLRADESHSSCVFADEIDRLRKGFESFYAAKHSGRQLTWQANLGTAEIRAYFPDCKGARKTRELNVQTYGMVILLLFNDLAPHASLSCEEIQARTQIPMGELIRHLQSLSVAPKTRILRKEPMSKDVNPTDQFSYNSSFYSQYQKVRVLLISSGNQVEAPDERNETQKRNDGEREGVIDAALVRIMKQRKESTHMKLIAEVLLQLSNRFSPDLSMVKKRVESLIDREYLERLDKEPPSYRYLA